MIQNKATVLTAEFLMGTPHFGDLPLHSGREVAVFGRSNAGKSTFINKACNRRALAKSSNTPGRTTECNFFKINYKVAQSTEKLEFFLIDTPGYGYAKFGKAKRRSTSKLLEQYLVKREDLHQIVLIADGRRDPEEEEQWIRGVAYERGIQFLYVPTKLDTLSRSKAINRANELQKLFKLNDENIFKKYFEASAEEVLGQLV